MEITTVFKTHTDASQIDVKDYIYTMEMITGDKIHSAQLLADTKTPLALFVSATRSYYARIVPNCRIDVNNRVR